MLDGFERYDMESLVPANVAAQAAYVSKQLFNYWRATDKIKPKGEDPATGRALYRLGDVLAVEKATRNTARSSRKPIRSGGLKPVDWATLNLATT